MSEEDIELERLKAKRLAEMQKNISSKQEETSKTSESSSSTSTVENHPKQNPRDLLVAKLGFRGLEVLENAESQFPNETVIVIEKLSELIKNGEIHEIIDGGKLLTLLRSIGLNIRMATKINVEQDGKFISLSDKLSSNQSSDKVNDE